MSELRHLLFSKGLMGPVLLGEKKITLRRFRKGTHDFKMSEIIIGEFEDGLTVLLRVLENVTTVPFYMLATKDAEEDGYTNASAALDGLRKYYPELNEEDICAVIRYEVLRIAETPVVAINEHTEED